MRKGEKGTFMLVLARFATGLGNAVTGDCSTMITSAKTWADTDALGNVSTRRLMGRWRFLLHQSDN